MTAGPGAGEAVTSGDGVAAGEASCGAGRESSAGVPVLAVHGVSFTYGKGWLFQDISFSLRPGCLGLIAGPSGSGKSTLLKVAAGILQPSEGQVTRGRPREPGGRRRGSALRVGYLPQQLPWAPGLPATARQAILAGRACRRWFLPWSHPDDGRAAEELAEQLGIAPVLDLALGQLSGGQLRRVGLAAALIGDPDLVILDEPTNDLDEEAAGAVRRAVAAYLKRGGAALVTTHREQEWEDKADWCLRLGP